VSNNTIPALKDPNPLQGSYKQTAMDIQRKEKLLLLMDSKGSCKEDLVRKERIEKRHKDSQKHN
jgi:hypothetical protein